MLRTTTAGFKIIKLSEGCRLKAYRCPAGKWTIGFGLTTGAIPGVAVTPGMRITQGDAEEYLREAVDIFEDRVEQLLGKASGKVSPHQFDAMVSLAYNIGLGNFAKSSVLKLTKAGKYDAAGRAFLSWNKATVDGVLKVLPGLTRRRQAEMSLYLSDVAHATTLAESLVDVDMPQAVEAPKGSVKSMASSKIGNGTIASAGLGLFSSGKEAVEEAQTAIRQGKDTFDTLMAMSPWLVVAVVIAAVAFYVWNERRNKMVEDVE